MVLKFLPKGGKLPMTGRIGVVFFPAFDWSLGEKHPEREERLLYTRDQLLEEGLLDRSQFLELSPRIASDTDLLKTHFFVPTIAEQMHPANRVAIGACLNLADSWHKKEIYKGFALVRPPGHHAMQVVHGNRGFCSINNVAVLVDYLRANFGYKRIAVIDSDVHHGDGTQDIFYHDPEVLFISFHQDGRTIFPGTGFAHEMGGPKAFGTTINIPLPPGTGDEGVRLITEEFILPIIDDFKPEIIINSAGQDNHFSDPLGSLRLTSRGYGDFTKSINPDLVLLEGGYAIETALPYVNMSVLLALASEEYRDIKEPGYSKALDRDSKTVLEQIKETLYKLKANLKNPSQVKSDFTKQRGSWVRNKNIFYDTEYFFERQKEVLHDCPNCSGILEIISEAQHGNGKLYPLHGFTLFPSTCSFCRTKAKQWYEEKNKRNMIPSSVQLINKEW